MSQNNQNPFSAQDERLAAFSNQAAAGKIHQADVDADEELRDLEETLLRLQNAFPPEPLTSAAVKQMHVRFKARARREAQQEKQPLWKKWFAPQPRMQFAIALAALTLAAAWLLARQPIAPSGAVSASAENSAIGWIVIALVVVLLIIVWIKRRK
ncbi:MAG: hypothetical protein Fur002_11570 [Anaerolineales bacterium]